MEEWIKCKIGDVCESISDTYKDNAKEVVLVNTSDVLNGKCLNHEKTINKNLKGQFKKTFKKDDILYSEIRPANKRFAYINFDAKDYIASTKLMVIRCNDKITPHYLFYILKSQSTINKLQVIAESRSGTFPQITFSELANLTIDLPSIRKQKEIVRFLKSLDDKIELNRRINDNLEQQARALFKSWFVDFEPFKNEKFVESELGMIPKGWRIGNLEEIGDIVGGSTPSKANPRYYTKKGIAWLTPKDLSISNKKFTKRGEIDITLDGYNSCSTKLMSKGSVLFSSRAPIGYITIAQNEICTNQGFKSVVPKVAGSAFIYYYLKSSTKEIENKSTGSTFKEASGALMKSLKVIIAPQEIFDSFEKYMNPIFKEQELIENESTSLSVFRDTLLPRLMSGELKPSEITI